MDISEDASCQALPVHWTIEFKRDVSLRALSGTGDAFDATLTGSDDFPLRCRLLAFDTARFSREAFQHHGIMLPDEVRNSVGKRQAEFFFGRIAARDALLDAGAAVGAASQVGMGASRQPLWPAPFSGSISHTRCHALATVCSPPRRGVGVDIEEIVEAGSADYLRDVVLDAGELALIQSLPAKWRTECVLTLAFSAKESLFKGAFSSVGKFFDFSAAKLVAFDGEGRRILLRIAEALSDEFEVDDEIEIGFGLVDERTVLTHFVW